MVLFFSTQSKKTFKSKQIGLIDKHLNELGLHFSGNMGLSHVRYPTSGNSESEIQPFQF